MISAKKFIILTILSVSLSKAYGQSEDKLGSWYIYNGFFKFSPKVELFFDSQLRTYEVTANPETFIVRPYFTYNINNHVQPGIGLEYLKFWTYDEIPENKTSLEEFRISLQLILSHKVDRFALQHRYRYEFRYIEGTPFQRMRYRLQVTVPFNSKELEKGSFFTNAYFETFVRTDPRLAFDQIWLYLAGGYQFTDNLNLQIGYLAVLQDTSTHSRLQFFLTHKLWFYK